MPRKDETRTPQKKIDQIIKRYIDGGESASKLIAELGRSKETRISRATFYNWLARYKEQRKSAAMTPAEIEKSEKITLRARVAQLEDENKRLLSKVMAMMLKYKEI